MDSVLPQEYTFPLDKLRRRTKHSNKTPLILVACGSYSPITILHLEMFELAQRHVQQAEPGFEVVGNYLSPCSDTYGKSSLVAAHHRIEMCKMAIQERQSNVMIDEWEILRRDSQGNPVYTPTHDVLLRLDDQINNILGGIQTPEGDFVKAKIVLLIGADLALTMSNVKSWPVSDIEILLGQFGAFVVERPTQCGIKEAIESLSKYHHNIWVVPSFENDVSSTKVRAQIQSGEPVLDIPKTVYEYIRTQGLYQQTSNAAVNGSTNGNAV